MYQFREIACFFRLPYAWFLDGGDGFHGVEELTGRLGLNEDVVEGLMLLADTGPDEVLEALDNTVYGLVSAVSAVREAE